MTSGRGLTVEELLALHPWPAEHAGERRVEWLWVYDVPIAVRDLWRVVADSSRMNRELKVSEMTFEDKGGVRRGSSRAGGLRQSWVEVPWSWVAEQWITALRVYDRGFARALFGVFHFTPIDEGSTRLHVYFGAVPRGWFGGLMLRLGVPSLDGGYRRLWRKVKEQIDRGEPPLVMPPPEPLLPPAEARLRSLSESLRASASGLDSRAIDALAEWIRGGDDNDLFRIQVRERARAWRVDEDTLLRVFLHATRAGLLKLSWDAVCPHCRGPTQGSEALSGLPAEDFCEACCIDFGTGANRAVEITFGVHSSIRDIPRRTFCSAEPATKDHIRVQVTVAPGAEITIQPRLARGRYRLRLHGERRYGWLDVGTGTDAHTKSVTWRASEPDREHTVGQEGQDAELRLVNDTEVEQRFIVEVSEWANLALLPGRLLSFQEFRDLFSDEYLAADVELAIGEQTILFTDMVGSTALYATRGDPAAFAEVKRHFTDVFAIIAKNRGAVVKTIGDAAMGAFNDPLDAVIAAREIQARFFETRDERPARLRISLNTGPCIAVKLNALIDYFGHTVNIAAKLQALAETWQITMADSVVVAPGVREWLAAEGAELEELEYASKALKEPISVKRWTVYSPE